MCINTMARRKKRLPQAIQAGSMADIAFLLLIFFLVSTEILNDKGIKVILPDYVEANVPQVGKSADILEVLINEDDDLMVEKMTIPIEMVKDRVKEFVMNPKATKDFASSPQRAVVSINSADDTSYERYVQVYSEIKQAYIELWTEQALVFYGRPIDQLTIPEINAIKERIPLRISEVEKH